MGGVGSGGHGANRGKRYWTARREREYHAWLIKQAAQKEARHQAALERARVKAGERQKNRRAENWAARAAGLPVPYPALMRHGGRERPGASTARVRRFHERRRVLVAAWKAALKEDRRRTRRIAKGLIPTPKTSTQRAQETRARKAAERATYLVSEWWAPALSEQDAKAIILNQHPTLDEMQLAFHYSRFVESCYGYSVNVNRFTLATGGVDGIAQANERRAIFNELHKAASLAGTADIEIVLKESEAIAALSDVPSCQVTYQDPSYAKNLIVNALDDAERMWRDGEQIRKNVGKQKGAVDGKQSNSDVLVGSS